MNDKTRLAILFCIAVVGSIMWGWMAIHGKMKDINSEIYKRSNFTIGQLRDEFKDRCGEQSKDVLNKLEKCVAYADAQTDRINKYQSLLTRNNERLSTLVAGVTTLNERASEHADGIDSISSTLDERVAEPIGDIVTFREELDKLLKAQADLLEAATIECSTSDRLLIDIGCIEDKSGVSESVLGLARVMSAKFESLDEQFDRDNEDALITQSMSTAQQTKTSLQSYIADAEIGRNADARQLDQLKRDIQVDRQALRRAVDWPSESVIVDGNKLFVTLPSLSVRCSSIRIIGDLVNEQGQPLPFDVEQDRNIGVTGTNAYFLTIGSRREDGKPIYPARLSIALDTTLNDDDKDNWYCEASFDDLPEPLRNALRDNPRFQNSSWKLRAELKSRRESEIENSRLWQ